VLVGPNGAGKSTLLKILADLVPITAGQRTPGHNINIGYFAQHRTEALNLQHTVLEEAMDGTSGISEQNVRSVLGSFLFRGDDAFKKVSVLSGGEKSRLALVKLLLNPPNLLLLDEPTTHLDMASINALINALQPYEGTIVFVSHDVHFIRSLAKNVLHINAGQLTPYAGDYDYYLEKSGASCDRQALVAELQNHRPPTISETEPAKPKLSLKQIKEQRRAESEARKAASAAKRQSEARRQEIEDRIIGLEKRQQELAAILESAPNDSVSFPLHRELAELSDALEAANAEWEALTEQSAV
jgi:ATP-binding cassette subfamily F protein 3